ncbi:hypothetical protein OAK51_03645 [Alphaproteobacteria bacterium]|jgi:hypothetical protein|nr:hypothetical protein [Alphaproteobacteria bacterium]|tara:strand:- start:63 stop:374 length:312 start_codon:yes stop_codon:yes gene_type:complete
MFGKILNFKFTSVSEAKLAASFCTEKFGSKISEYKIIGLNIFIGQTGDLNVSIKFENPDAVNQFENNYVNIISDLKESLVFKENNFVGVCAYTYEKEAASTEM